MKKNTVLLLLLLAAGVLPAQNLGKTLGKLKDEVVGGSLSQEEVGNGLKEALNVGVEEAVAFLSAEDGYYKSVYKVLLPEEAQQVTAKLRSVPGFSDAEEKLVLKINRAAESAAKKATPIFADAITGMSFRDAFDILKGEDDAATRYLERTTYDRLFAEFKPVVIAALDEVNAREYWRSLTTAYNKIPFSKSVTTELDEYVTQKALAGLFLKVEEKEQDIRQNTAARTSDLLKRVFEQQD